MATQALHLAERDGYTGVLRQSLQLAAYKKTKWLIDMDLIEQAVFTSAETDRSAGYQVVATSPGVTEDDARELTVWGPSHDALLPSADALSINFHRLPSGAYCIGRTTLAGSEYSGRRGARVYTQCLIVSPSSLWRFGNNPFALFKAAAAGGSLRSYGEVPKRLEPLRIVGRAAVVDPSLLERLCDELGPAWLASLVQAALESTMVAVTGSGSAQQVIAGLINCLPPECRTEFSFCTGLKLSSRRPYRIVALPNDSGERRRAMRLYDLVVMDLAGDPPAEAVPTESWARLIHRVLASHRTSFLSRRLSEPRGDFSPQDLSALGLQLMEELDASSLENAPLEMGSGLTESEATGPGRTFRRDHRPHPGFQREPAATTALRSWIEPPSERLQSDSPQVMEKLERLDDLVYGAIAEDAALAQQLESFWPQVRAELGEELVAESREQYLRYALKVWEKFVDLADPTDVHRSQRALRALDVLCLLFDEVT